MMLTSTLENIGIINGEVFVNGISLNESTVNELRRMVAYVPQELYLPCEYVSEMVMLLFELKANKKASFLADGYNDQNEPITNKQRKNR